MKYDQYTYLYPPRPENAVSPETVSTIENMGYWAQIKRNGDCTLIFSRGDEVRFMNRHDQVPTRWSPKEYHNDFFKGNDRWRVFVGERIADTLYLFDQIVHDGIQLVGMTFRERQELIHSHWSGVEEEREVRITPWLTVAKSIKTDFAGVFASLNDPRDEGLVMKKPDAPLKSCFRDKANASWQVKSRVSTKNYTF